MAAADPNRVAIIDGQMTVLAVICAKTLSFFGHLAGSQIDFGRFAPMFRLNAA
jgi:hypothetical protein